MALRHLYRPLRPDLDGFLFAAVGDEINGVPLTTVSALTRLGLDPWEEAGRLSSLNKDEAVEQFARLIVELPDIRRPLPEARELAVGLVALLPKHSPTRMAEPQVRQRPMRARKLKLKLSVSQVGLICLVLSAAAVIGMIVHVGLPFGIGAGP